VAPLADAFVRVRADTSMLPREIKKGFDQASPDKMGRAFGSTFAASASSALRRLAIGAALTDTVSKAGDFDKTIRTIGVTTGETGDKLRELSGLALDMGAKTTFSAAGASDAMLELAKGGLNAAQIKAGALEETLTLASAGGLALGDAATFMVQGLTTFGLKATEANQVAAALAGGANASTASVESMGQALSQVGPSARLAGLSVQETTAALAAFDNAGVKGSDAGTSLKTMLMNLTPSTDDAAHAMKDLGVKFTDAKGQFLPLRDIAEKLKKSMSGLSSEQQTVALKMMFGSDAFRAAAILAREGSAGIDKYTKATSNLGAAQDLAKTATEGYAGAWEQFKGSIETAQIQIGTKLLPVLTTVFDYLSTHVVPTLGTFTDFLMRNQNVIVPLAAGIASVVAAVKIYTTVTKIAAGVQLAFNTVMAANPIGVVALALIGLSTAFVVAYKKSETFRQAIDSMWRGIKTIFAEGIKFVVNIFFGFVEKFLRIGGKVIGFFNHDMGAAMEKAANDVNDAKNEINAKLDQLKNPTITIGVQLDEGARAAIKAFGRKNVVVSGGHLVGIRQGAGIQRAYNTGGQIGNGYGNRDDVPALLTRGEHVWTTAEVRAVGGHAAMEQLRRAALSGRLPVFAKGGAVRTRLPSHADVAALAAKVAAVGEAAGRGIGSNVSQGLSSFLNKLAAAASAGPGQLGAWITRAIQIAGVPGNWGAPMRTLVMRESGGNPHAVNLWDINAMRGMPSGGLAQVIGPTFAAYRDRSLPNNVFDPIANLVASLRYIRSRYGSIFNVQQANAALPPKGYDAGGILDHGSTGINTSGRPERVLDPTTTAAFERLVSVLERGGTTPTRGASVIVNVAPRQRRLGYDVGNAVASTFILNGWA
jgi:TP901 family phage tail tape measure protein